MEFSQAVFADRVSAGVGKVVAIPGAPMINKLAQALTTMGFSLRGAVKLTLVLVLGTVFFAGLGEVSSGLF